MLLFDTVPYDVPILWQTCYQYTINPEYISATLADINGSIKHGETTYRPDDGSRYIKISETENATSNAEKSVLENFEQRIFRKLHFPSRWEQDGVAPPNVAAKEKCFASCKQLFQKYNLIPDKIVASVEEGICISYDKITYDFNKSIMIDVYNDMDVALIICDNTKKTVIYSEDVSGMDFNKAVSIFNAYMG